MFALRPLPIAAVFIYFALHTFASPTLTIKGNPINLGVPITVCYARTDGLDGRPENDASNFAATTGYDWIGMYEVGACSSGDNNQDKHQCYMTWEYVKPFTADGCVSFEADTYKSAGEYEFRYFYGDDPTVPGTYTWIGQGYVCNSFDNTTVDGPRTEYTSNDGMSGNPQIAGLTLAQCQCNPEAETQTIASCDDTSITESADCIDSCNYDDYAHAKGETVAEHYSDMGETFVHYGPRPTENAAQCSEYGGTWTVRTWGYTVDQETCLSYRAACSRCMLDAAATSSPVKVMGAFGSGDGVYQDMASSLPGFEIGF